MGDRIQVETGRPSEPLQPAAFTWKGQRHPITGLGRQWRSKDGNHFLVTVSGRRVYEIRLDPSDGTWHLVRTPESLGAPGQPT